MKHYVSKKREIQYYAMIRMGGFVLPMQNCEGFCLRLFCLREFCLGGFVRPPYCVCLNMTHCDSLTMTYYEYLIFWMFFRMDNSKHDQLMH